MFATIDWSVLVAPIAEQIDAALPYVLAALGTILGITYAIRWALGRFSMQDAWAWYHRKEIAEYDRGERDTIG